MTHDRDLDSRVRTWLDEPPPGPPDRDAVYARVLDRLPETHQRRRRWPFQWNPFAAGATRSADANGPHPQERSNTMLNVTRAVAIVAVLALGMSFAVVVGPLQGPEAGAPGAELSEAQRLNELVLEVANENDRELLYQLYATDAKHTVIYPTEVSEYDGVDALAEPLLHESTFNSIAPIMELGESDGQVRWMSFLEMVHRPSQSESHQVWPGIVCSFWAEDGVITRHDCIMPESYVEPNVE